MQAQQQSHLIMMYFQPLTFLSLRSLFRRRSFFPAILSVFFSGSEIDRPNLGGYQLGRLRNNGHRNTWRHATITPDTGHDIGQDRRRRQIGVAAACADEYSSSYPGRAEEYFALDGSPLILPH